MMLELLMLGIGRQVSLAIFGVDELSALAVVVVRRPRGT